jgi:ribonuclease HIII
MRQPDLFPGEKGHIGTDESGKGDYFGPLVVAGLFLPDNQQEVFRELGVKDSKRFSDNRVRELADMIKKGYTFSLVVIGPEKYNELHGKLRNLNKILAWAHSRAIENLLEEVSCGLAVTDQFGDKLYIQNALMKRGRNVELVQMPKAEEDLAVAGASILARAEFLRRLYFLSQDVDIELPKGASPKVEEAGLRLVKKHGPEILNRVAKTHFKITPRIMNLVNSKQ